MSQKTVDEALAHASDSEHASVISVPAKSDDNSRKATSSRLKVKDLDIRMTVMENSMKASLGHIKETLDNLLSAQKTGGGNTSPRSADVVMMDYDSRDSFPKGKSRPLVSLNNGIDPDIVEGDVDILSIQPNRAEIRALFESDHCDSQSVKSDLSQNLQKDKFMQYTKDDRPDLGSMFGDIAVPDENTKQGGLLLAEAQEKMIRKSWRTDTPDRLSAYKEEYRVCFPVHENSQAILKVPSLDDMLEPMLSKRHGSKGFKPWSKSRQLSTQPLKAIETLGYQGQVASRMNIIALAYLQQGLGALLNNLQQKDINVDKSIQNVRDLYDMSNKALDQAGRSGAFHHMIRRKAAVEDTGLNTLKDVHTKVSFLPLSGEGVFGSGLTEKLKSRKEQREQLSDLVPEFFDKNTLKRKFQTQTQEKSSFKHQRTDNNYNSSRGRGRYNHTPREQTNRSSYRRSTADFQKQDKNATGLQSFRIPKKQ